MSQDSSVSLSVILTTVYPVSCLIALIGMTQIFAYFSRGDALLYLPGAPFLLSALLMALGLGLFWRLRLSAQA